MSIPVWKSPFATEQTFVTFLRGRTNVTPLVPSTSMANLDEESLPDTKAKDIYAYIRTFKSSAPDLKFGEAGQELIAVAGLSRHLTPFAELALRPLGRHAPRG